VAGDEHRDHLVAHFVVRQRRALGVAGVQQHGEQVVWSRGLCLHRAPLDDDAAHGGVDARDCFAAAPRAGHHVRAEREHAHAGQRVDVRQRSVDVASEADLHCIEFDAEQRARDDAQAQILERALEIEQVAVAP